MHLYLDRTVSMTEPEDAPLVRLLVPTFFLLWVRRLPHFVFTKGSSAATQNVAFHVFRPCQTIRGSACSIASCVVMRIN